MKNISMIPEIKHKLIFDLVISNPEIFKNTSMIGIFDGQDICSCFLNSAHVLNKLKFYENFQDSDENSQEKLLNLYSNWQQQISNLEIIIGDGTENLDYSGLDFLFTDAYNIDYRTYFLNNKFDNTLLAICGYGAELARTIDLSVIIDNKKIFPVMLYNGFLFFTNNIEKHTEIYTKFKTFLNNSQTSYVTRRNCLRPNGWYHSLLKLDKI